MARSKKSASDGALDGAWLDFADAVLARHAIDRGAKSSLPVADLDAAVVASRNRFHDSLASEVPFATVVANAGLSLMEAEVLALAAAVEQSRARQSLLTFAHDDLARPRLMIDSVRALLGHAHVLALGPGSGLVASALVDVVADGSWSEQLVSVHPTVLWALAGSIAPDPDLPVDAVFVGTDQPHGELLVVVTGEDQMRRRQAATRCTRGTRFLATPLPATPSEWSAVVREATLVGCGLILELEDNLPDAARRWIMRAVHLPWAISSKQDISVHEIPRRSWVEFEVPPSDPTDDEWSSLVGAGIARSHSLTFDQLHTVSRVLPARSGDLDAAVRRLGGGRLAQLARRIRPSRTWNDVVLSTEQIDLLRGLIDRYRFADRVYGEWGFSAQPSTGIVALFSGPSGTGKTLTAEIVAGELGLDVFKLDLSAVVSKYIGETEKNLEQIFDAAGAGNLVLFFDEADALFGKRSEVKDARDRYANIEVSYLLQRLEAYEGLVIMATNFEKNVDEAFLRRIHVRVEFALPGVDERAKIWQLNLPATAPVSAVDVQWLAAQFEISGAMIRNASVHAAFAAAAQADPVIAMETVVVGVAKEYRKVGRLLKREQFGEYAKLVGAS